MEEKERGDRENRWKRGGGREGERRIGEEK